MLVKLGIDSQLVFAAHAPPPPINTYSDNCIHKHGNTCIYMNINKKLWLKASVLIWNFMWKAAAYQKGYKCFLWAVKAYVLLSSSFFKVDINLQPADSFMRQTWLSLQMIWVYKTCLSTGCDHFTNAGARLQDHRVLYRNERWRTRL